MKVVILAGGFGTRLSEETVLKPKPMIDIGGMPILWHIMKTYSYYGHNEFIICLGYKGYVIKEYFANYFMHMADVTFDMERNTMEVHNKKAEPWKVTLIDTGLNTMTGGRVKRIQSFIKDEPFMLTYGDGVSDVDISELLQFHQKHGKIGTMTAVQPSGRFGALELAADASILSFKEKPKGDGSWINGGFFVMNPGIFDYIDDDSVVFERKPLEQLAKDNQLSAFKHSGFWKPMDTLREKVELEDLWVSGKAPWKVWK
ncbi:MAG: glucose-1-phosphate cytidylyltransferase [Spirochaetes bacterium GWD1_61_31]|nr:MAG: glucose-1-phosphate cytidylyltransferase [Spirochaetes bacterium GWB1_60_80]OHD31867.1 MAG: glucose-1-phosphate cytidylyltransferase [Spirochaetes bacterium GWC1_61_12]OHD40036.1 MAG: glucose-1-phosphate cytidylyltransferase [Spirochaetes bacterium GWD1_61_31]OHD42310.1 MAG: glucose-1-phosphate cytidylyltransferase [Spirochaetes bacterium GWE1_60_18]OHD58458.1 MAG: glucose-1-phosphate cytidylyltransferase [Spirochaetes bacterium GWF1_60_12]HAW85446.1 glucose-1-phosphate cytidylyltransf